MAGEVAGKDCVLKISGAALPMVGEATTEDGTTKLYQITAAAKRILDRTGTIRVHKKTTGAAAEVSTSTTVIHYTSHGLVVGDLICNETRSNTFRLVLTKNDDDFTVAAITDQVAGDTIMRYPSELATAYSLNRLNGRVTYAGAATRVIKISGDYLPMATAGYANSASNSRAAELLDTSSFGNTHKKRIAGLKSASGVLTQFNVADTTYIDALVAGLPIVIEQDTAAADEPDRFWALLESTEVAAAVEGVQSESVSWVSYDAWLRLGA